MAAQILFRNYTRISVRCDPFVQRRHLGTQIIRHLFARKPTGQRDPHCILTKIRPSVSVP
jgi:hypothetical protein